MKYAENNRITHRQLRRQIVLAYLAPLLLCLPGRGRLLGIPGLLGILCAVLLLFFYIIFLIRVSPAFADVTKTVGAFWGRLLAAFFLAYTILTAAYLLWLLGELVPGSLLIGVPGEVVSVSAAVVCSLGTHRGIQKRGRVAEVSGGVLLAGVLLMLVLCLGQASWQQVEDMWESFQFQSVDFRDSCYGLLCAFAGLTLLPFSLLFVEKKSLSGRAIGTAVFILGGILAAVLVLLPAVLGWERSVQEEYPVLPLLAGADLPGDVLARFDVIWMAFLLYSLLFAIGSLLYYGSHILQSAHMGNGRFWVGAAALVLALDWIPRFSIEYFYFDYVAWIFLPGAVIIQVLFLMRGKGKRRIAGAAALVLMCLFLNGCAGVEPEKRLYPLAMSVDMEEDGELWVTYAMADLQASTGQEKEEESGFRSVLSLRGADFQEIEALYDRSQEKYLDLGHLEVLILGERLMQSGQYPMVLTYLKEQAFVGENMYLFVAGDISGVMEFEDAKSSSVGEYLKGIYENRPFGQAKKGVTLRDAYVSWYKGSGLPPLPRLVLEEGELQVMEKAA